MRTWGVAKAKAQFSAVLDLAESEGPQLVKRRKQEFYVVTKEHLADKVPDAAHESMADFLMKSPLRGSGIKLGRVNLRARKVEL